MLLSVYKYAAVSVDMHYIIKWWYGYVEYDNVTVLGKRIEKDTFTVSDEMFWIINFFNIFWPTRIKQLQVNWKDKSRNSNNSYVDSLMFITYCHLIKVDGVVSTVRDEQ